MHLITLWVPNLHKENAQLFENVVATIDGVGSVDIWMGKAEIMIKDTTVLSTLVSALQNNQFIIQNNNLIEQSATMIESSQPTTSSTPDAVRFVSISGMTCRSCEITIERKFRKIKGVKKVEVDAARGHARIVCANNCVPDTKELHNAIAHHGYTVQGMSIEKNIAAMEKPSLGKIVGLFVLVLIVTSIFSKLGILKSNYAVGASIGFFAAIVLGLVAGSSSCLAVSGGLLLSAAGKFREKYGGTTLATRMKPVLMFVGGRVLSYSLLGGIIGLVGKTLTPSPFVTGALMVLAATFMIIMGLDMLKIAPAWLKGLLPRMPKSLSHKIMDAEGKESPVMPFLLGAGTFFLPCGFTQSLQLYALTTGSFFNSAIVLGAFALGTAPALLALGWASSSLKGKLGQWFFQFSGALVVVLGITNLQNGFTIAGYPLSPPKWNTQSVTAPAYAAGDLPPIVQGKQIIKMTVNGGYSPNEFTIKAGVPVEWQISGTNVAGCISILQSPKLGISTSLKPGPNLVSFTPETPGRYVFSCSMGMYRGTFTVVP